MAAAVRGPRSFLYDLSGRDRDFAYFKIPDPIVLTCGIAPSRTKRQTPSWSVIARVTSACSWRSARPRG
jgi:hypothetical protein